MKDTGDRVREDWEEVIVGRQTLYVRGKVGAKTIHDLASL